MTNPHPLTPPDKLLKQWRKEASIALNSTLDLRDYAIAREKWIAIKASQWAADQELGACCDVLACWPLRSLDGTPGPVLLRAARRPKPKSQAEEALADLDGLMNELDRGGFYSSCAERIRRALRRLQEHEQQVTEPIKEDN